MYRLLSSMRPLSGFWLAVTQPKLNLTSKPGLYTRVILCSGVSELGEGVGRGWGEGFEGGGVR